MRINHGLSGYSSPPPVASSWPAPCAPEPERLGSGNHRGNDGKNGFHIWIAEIRMRIRINILIIMIIIIIMFSRILEPL